ncbi:hypothetical protein HIM_04643 [Hirsutella minnesotensis 3608]|uniref:Methyltransferase n=1 Tax=Hirsutella minnesotensis 3608 TaxID=1043627 RepID=A0A0F8A5S1_9HYPO|nr:hypothetical protein HIM_04643 [Hirsutella minnesotensis 3608]
MGLSTVVPRGDVVATLHYYGPPLDEGALPFTHVGTPPAGEPQRNYSDAAHETLVRDVRGREPHFTLDNDAFQVMAGVPPSRETAFVEDESIWQNYYPEVERLLLDAIPGSSRVYIFDHTVRRANQAASRSPLTRVHIDQTALAAAQRVRRYLPDEADSLLRGRYRIVNVWRPLNKDPVESFPLSFASTSTLHHDDVVPIERRYPDGYLGQTAAIRYNPAQKWYYLSGMTADEALLLECFDSESLKPGSRIGGRVPHTAFVDPRTRPGAVGRESIEVRALVFGP